MNMVINSTPVLFINPRTKLPDQMPLAMVDAYVPYMSYLNLEEAARVAQIRDEEAAVNLMESALPEELEVISAQAIPVR